MFSNDQLLNALRQGPQKWEETPLDNHPRVYVLNVSYGWYLWLRAIVEETATYTYRLLTGTQITGLQTWEYLQELPMRYDITSQHHILAWVIGQAIAVYPSKHPRVLNIAGNYAHTLYIQRQFSQAEQQYTWLLASQKEILGYYHPATIGALQWIGRLRLVYRRDCGIALNLLQIATEIREYSLKSSDVCAVNDKNSLKNRRIKDSLGDIVTVHLVSGFLQYALNLCLAQHPPGRTANREIRLRVERKLLKAQIPGGVTISAEDDGCRPDEQWITHTGHYSRRKEHSRISATRKSLEGGSKSDQPAV